MVIIAELGFGVGAREAAPRGGGRHEGVDSGQRRELTAEFGGLVKAREVSRDEFFEVHSQMHLLISSFHNWPW